MACGEHDLVIVFSTATRPSGVREESSLGRDVIIEKSENESENEKKIEFKRGLKGRGERARKEEGQLTSLLWPPDAKQVRGDWSLGKPH